MILGCQFRLGAGRAAPERFLREKRKSRVRTNFVPPKPENRQTLGLAAHCSAGSYRALPAGLPAIECISPRDVNGLLLLTTCPLLTSCCGLAR